MFVRDELRFFVPTRLVNPTNAREFWTKRAARAQQQREAVAACVLTALADPRLIGGAWRISAKAATPKAVTFHAKVPRLFDSDGLQAACKSLRDGLQDVGLIDTDGPTSGHTFDYQQEVARPYGVTIRVSIQSQSPSSPASPPAGVLARP